MGLQNKRCLFDIVPWFLCSDILALPTSTRNPSVPAHGWDHRWCGHESRGWNSHPECCHPRRNGRLVLCWKPVPILWLWYLWGTCHGRQKDLMSSLKPWLLNIFEKTLKFWNKIYKDVKKSYFIFLSSDKEQILDN